MELIDFILNLAGLLMWLSWRSVPYDPLTKRTPATLIGTLRPAQPSRWRQWHLLVAIACLLAGRAVIYWQIGSAAGWVGRLDLGVISLAIPFHGAFHDLYSNILLYSVLSFGRALGVVYLWLLLLSLLAGPDPLHRLVRVQLGVIDRWPRWVKLLLPLVVTFFFWWVATWVFTNMAIGGNTRTHFIPRPVSAAQRMESALLVGLGSYLVWKFVIGILLILHLLNTYLYFGRQPFWDYVNKTAHTLLRPLGKIPLRVGRVDFAPVVGLAIVFFAAVQLEMLLHWLYVRTPW
jgi:uncharacterized protein YggT (Ycf19 family)